MMNMRLMTVGLMMTALAACAPAIPDSGAGVDPGAGPRLVGVHIRRAVLFLYIHIKQIIDIELDSLLKRINTLGYNIKISEKAKDFVAEKGFDAQFGARPLKRAIQKYIEDPLAEDIINSNLKEGDTIALDTNKEETVLKIKISKPRKESKKAKDKLKG